MINKNSIMTQDYINCNGQFPYKVLDFHAHMGNFNGGYMPYGSAEKMLQLMDQANVRCAFFASHSGLQIGNKYITEEVDVCKKYPGRFKIYMPVFSRYSDAKEDIKYFESEREQFVGFKIHPSFTGVSLDDPRNTPYWEYADANGLLVLVHTWHGLETQTENVLKKYKNVKMVGGHCFFNNWQFAADMANTYENFYPELTAVLAKRGALEEIIEGCGSEKILFGTDMPWFAYTYYIGAILAADITDEMRKNILWNNGVNLLKRYDINLVV